MTNESFDDECRRMTDDCLHKKRADKLSSFELEFCRSMQKKLGSYAPMLSPKQYTVLERIWEKVTADG